MTGFLLSHGDNSNIGVKAEKRCRSEVECFPGTPSVEDMAQWWSRLPGRLTPSTGQKEVIETVCDLAVESMKSILLPIMNH